MNLFQIFDSISKVDDEALGRFDSRRAVFGQMFSAGKKLTAAAAPLVLSSFFNKAYAGDRSVRESVTQVLQYALRLERLEFAFYDQALTGAASTLPAAIKSDVGLLEIRANERSHVTLLEGALGAANLPAADNVKFDKVYTSVFTDQGTFMAVAQALEDTGVRAYKGRAAELMSSPDVLEIALNIHSVEARHASHIRRMRGEQAWITGEATTIPTVGGIPGNTFYKAGNPAADYPSEAMATQAAQSGLYAGNGIAADRYSEAFDEPVDPTTVLANVAAAFLIP